jgi:hypothetical protein
MTIPRVAAALGLASVLIVSSGCIASGSDVATSTAELTKQHEHLEQTIGEVGKGVVAGDKDRVEAIAAKALAEAKDATKKADDALNAAIKHEGSIKGIVGDVARVVDDIATGGRIGKAIDRVADRVESVTSKVDTVATGLESEQANRKAGETVTSARVGGVEAAVKTLNDGIVDRLKALSEEDKRTLEQVQNDRERFFDELSKRASLTTEEKKELQQKGLSTTEIIGLIGAGSVAAGAAGKMGKSRSQPEIDRLKEDVATLKAK